MNKLLYAATAVTGYKRNQNEDYILVHEFDDGSILSITADGAGSRGTSYQPAAICALEIRNMVNRVYEDYPNALSTQTEAVLTMALTSAGRVLAAFKSANEEVYNGYAASLACCYFRADGTVSYVNTGNTRIHLLRVNKDNVFTVRQLTKDQTEGQKMVEEGKLTIPEYHLSRERLVITGGLGIAENPIIQSFTMKLKPNDMLLITSDGIHYALRPEVMGEIIRRSADVNEAVKVLADAAEQTQYNDNAAASLFWFAEVKET